MSPVAITLLVIVIVLAIIIAVLYFLGKKAQKKQAEQQELLDANKQTVSMLIIDKKRMKLKDAGLPQMVIAAGIIAAGVYLLSQQKKNLSEDGSDKDEHYWEPYRPYQQPADSDVNTAPDQTAGNSAEALPGNVVPTSRTEAAHKNDDTSDKENTPDSSLQ